MIGNLSKPLSAGVERHQLKRGRLETVLLKEDKDMDAKSKKSFYSDYRASG